MARGYGRFFVNCRMISIREKIPGKNGFLTGVTSGDYEFVNPIEKIGEILFHFNLNLIRNFSDLSPEEISEFSEGIDIETLFEWAAVRRAMVDYDKYMKDIKSAKV